MVLSHNSGPFSENMLPQFTENTHVVGLGDCFILWNPVDEQHTLPVEENDEMRFDFQLAAPSFFDARFVGSQPHYTGTFFHQVVLKYPIPVLTFKLHHTN